MIALKNVALRRGGRLLLSEVDLGLHDGWRVGVVGRNGCGKSSLFAALMGELEVDAGQIDFPNQLRIASVAQETPSLPDPAIEYVLAGDAPLWAALSAEAAATAAGDHMAAAEAHHEIELLRGYDARSRAGRLMHGLGFDASVHDRPVASFSGGWRVRLNLARALMTPSDLLLLDEPTNHLDLDAVLWLEQWLVRYTGTLLLISHDREFLDGVCTHVTHLHDGAAKLYSGDFTSFERQRAEQLRQQQISHEREQVVRAHLQSFIDRFKAKASKAKQAQSRMKRLEKLSGTEAVRAESPFRFAFPTPDDLPSPLLRLDALNCGYRDQSGGVAKILDMVKFGLEPGDRVALLGPNGAGKSTLVKTIVGELAPLSGERQLHPQVRVGYFAQHTVEALQAGQSPIGHLAKIAPGVAEQGLRNFLGRWNFVGDRAFEKVDDFSGGERARLALALIAWTQPNLLLLDEPTNHLDMEMREALAEALAEFNGALVLVSHDRHLIGMCCDRFWRVADGSVDAFDGDLDDYAVWLRRRDKSVGSGSSPAPAAAQSAVEPVSAKERRRLAAEIRDKQRPMRSRLKTIEGKLEQLGAQRIEVERELADPDIYAGDGSAAATLIEKQTELRFAQARLEAEWLELSTALEELAPADP